MMNRLRFGDYLREVGVSQAKVSYKLLMPKIRKGEDGKDQPYQPPRLKLSGLEVQRLLSPYVSVRFMEQLRAVLPLAVYLVLFQILALQTPVQDALSIGFGLVAVMVGLMLFMEGLKLGLMPFGEIIGNSLPKKAGLPLVLTIIFILGVGVTFAEPAIGALQAITVDKERAPILFAMLNQYPLQLALCVGAGVGLAAIAGTVRFIYGWSLKPFIYISLVPAVALSLWCYFDPQLKHVVGLAWDCGGVTTGPVTVPLVLSLGIGVAAAVGKAGGSLSGFGIVTLASVFPIVTVLLMGIVLQTQITPEQIKAAAALASDVQKPWWERSPGVEIVMGVRAIVPLVLFLLIVFKGVLKERFKSPFIITYGLCLAVVGMCVFNLGLTYGLSILGNQSGGLVPGAFEQIAAMPAPKSPLYSYGFGIFVAIVFAFVLGLGATLAEPALNALGITVETLTSGAFRKGFLMWAVAVGVGVGIAVGVLKIVYDIPLLYILIPAYVVAVIFTALSSEEYVNIAWDSAGVTTGPVTVPLVLAMGMGFGTALNAIEGFGILAAASVFPIIAVLGLGLYVQWTVRRINALKSKETRKEEVVIA